MPHAFQAAAVRRYTTAVPKKASGNLPVIFLGAGILSAAGAYWYLDQSKPKQEKSPIDPHNFIDFKLKKVLPYNHNSSTSVCSLPFRFIPLITLLSFIFELPNNDASLIPVASCLLVKASDPEALKDPKGKPIIRPYTPVSPSDAPGVLTLLVKRYENGNMSKYIHTLKVLTFFNPLLFISPFFTGRRYPLY